MANRFIERHRGEPFRLYLASTDLGERRNVAARHPEVVREMAALLG